MIKHNEISIERSKNIENILFRNNFKIIKKFDFNYIFENTKFL